MSSHHTTPGHTRPNVYAADPVSLTIVGGKHILQGDEAGPLDTDDGPEHPLYDPRIADPLDDTEDPLFTESVYLYGVRTPILVVKLDNSYLVVAGRRRVRAARVANARYRREGRPDQMVHVTYRMRVVKRLRPNESMVDRFLENSGRRQDTPRQVLEGLTSFLSRGDNLDEASIAFQIPKPQIQALLKFDATACPALREAFDAGLIGIHGALTIARLPVDQQVLALADARSAAPRGPKIKTRKEVTGKAATVAAKIARGEIAHPPLDRREVSALARRIDRDLAQVASQETGEPVDAARDRHYGAYLTGAAEVLRLLQGRGEEGALRALLDEIRAPAPAAALSVTLSEPEEGDEVDDAETVDAAPEDAQS